MQGFNQRQIFTGAKGVGDKMKTIKCFRWVKDDLTSKNGTMTWETGKWNKVNGELKMCENGLHAYTDAFESINNVFGNRWFVSEARGKILKEKNSTNICSDEMRLNKEIPSIVWKRFALFCAKDCLKNYEKEYPNDKRVSDCIKATEDFLDGKITKGELIKARSAAWSAESAAESVAELVARSAAWSAAWSAESAAESARSAESAWSAAWSAARSAESAARSARSAAESARSAAWSAWSAAESVAKKRQKQELLRLIKEYVK
jgi:hypothetical protein